MRSLGIGALVFVLLSSAAPASGAYDPVSNGSTTIVFSYGFGHLLREHEVTIEARRGARVRGDRITLPVSGGRLDPVTAKGVVEHAGAVVFRVGNRRLPMKSLQLKTTQRRSPLSAKFGGGQLRLAESSQLMTSRAGFGLAATVGKIRLSAKVAVRLDRKLGLRGVFEAGELVGQARTVVEPETSALLPEGSAGLDLAPTFATKLEKLFVAVNPVFPAEHPGPFTFPIAGREIAPDGAAGTVRLAGSLELLQLGGGQIFWVDPYLDLGSGALSAEADLEPSPKLPGKLGRVTLFDLGTGSVVSEPGARTVEVTGAPLTLTADTARYLNQAFAPEAPMFAPGELVGTVGFKAQAH
jgi:hypothetical protein